ncbi:MAG TPA: FHA domain-containing protein [Nitriliruptorales bacterium]
MAATVTCPQGHESQAPDYCDTCGTAIAAPSAEPAAAGGGKEVVGNCPECATPRIQGESFCEVCGLDYATGKLPKAPVAPPQPADPAPEARAGSGWSVTLEADADWHAAQDFESADVAFPDGYQPRTLDLTGDVVTVGRRSDADGWYPDVDLSAGHDDRAASRRHAELRRTADGWELVDLGSTNGTSLNGALIAVGEARPLHDGDRINLGGFTRMIVHQPQED